MTPRALRGGAHAREGPPNAWQERAVGGCGHDACQHPGSSPSSPSGSYTPAHIAGAIPMKPFRVTGEFRMGRTHTPFTMETLGEDAAGAQDRVLATIGSRHRVDRHHITVKDVKEIRLDEVTDPVVEKRLSMVK